MPHLSNNKNPNWPTHRAGPQHVSYRGGRYPSPAMNRNKNMNMNSMNPTSPVSPTRHTLVPRLADNYDYNYDSYPATVSPAAAFQHPQYRHQMPSYDNRQDSWNTSSSHSQHPHQLTQDEQYHHTHHRIERQTLPSTSQHTTRQIRSRQEADEEEAATALLMSAGGARRNQDSPLHSSRHTIQEAAEVSPTIATKTSTEHPSPLSLCNSLPPTSSSTHDDDNQNTTKENFPTTLHDLLTKSEFSGKVLEWLPSGTSWRVLRWDDLADQLIPKHFPHLCENADSTSSGNNNTSGTVNRFLEELKSWGFEEVKEVGPNMGTFRHEFFLSIAPTLCKYLAHKDGVTTTTTTTNNISSTDSSLSPSSNIHNQASFESPPRPTKPTSIPTMDHEESDKITVTPTCSYPDTPPNKRQRVTYDEREHKSYLVTPSSRHVSFAATDRDYFLPTPHSHAHMPNTVYVNNLNLENARGGRELHSVRGKPNTLRSRRGGARSVVVHDRVYEDDVLPASSSNRSYPVFSNRGKFSHLPPQVVRGSKKPNHFTDDVVPVVYHGDVDSQPLQMSHGTTMPANPGHKRNISLDASGSVSSVGSTTAATE